MIIIDKILFHSDSTHIDLNTNNRDYIEIVDPKFPTPELLTYYFNLRLAEDPRLIACIYADKRCTMEPIHMILGALKKTKLRRIVYMTEEPKIEVNI